MRCSKIKLLEWFRSKFHQNPSILSALLLALVIRLLLLPWFSDSLNFYGYKLTTSFLQQGRDPWLGIASDPALAQLNPWGYPPPFLLVTSIASWLSIGNGYVFGLLIRLPGVSADLLTGLFLFRIGLATGVSERNSRVMAFAYLFNPFVILVSSIWGTIDPLPVMFVTIALFYMLRNRRSPNLAALMFGLGIAFKLYPIIFVPVGIATVPRLFAKTRFLIIAVTPFLVTSLPALIYSSRQYFSVLAGFTTGIASNGLGLYLSLWWLLEIAGVRITSTILLLDELGYILLISALSWAVLKNKLSFIRATTVAILTLFIAAPRLNENYLLWALPIISIICYAQPWSTRRRIFAQISWIPFALSAVLYNGVPGVAVGFSYWSLVSLGMTRTYFQFFPNWTRPMLVTVTVFIVVLTTCIVLLLNDRVSHTLARDSFRVDILLRRVTRIEVKRTLPWFLALSMIFLVSSSAVNSYHYNVLPEDYGSYVLQGSQVVFHDSFRSLLLGPTWQFGGTGTMSLQGTGITLDTMTPGGTAWISRSIPNESFELSFDASVVRIYGSTGSLILIRVPGGWLGVERALPPRNLTYLSLFYYDEVSAVRYFLGTIPFGALFSSSFKVSANTTTISFNQTVVLASGRSPIQRVQLGQTDAIHDGGGQIILKQMQVSWPIVRDPLLFWFAPATLWLTVIVLTLPIVWEGHQRRRFHTRPRMRPKTPRESPLA